eukprot:TRINITY_DN20840_c1_g4_i1.p1 TRINITY_DN20840_c1_g4~~TRINITY_DN20840_c1_g4_i1.p1  ORF type:complete len:175 (+),score=77.94 TRINITY_DN20840_c1_g4_i1:100-624(+)
MEVEPELLVLGVVAEQQKARGSQRKGQAVKGLSLPAIEGVLLKKFGSCLPAAAKVRTSEWLAGVLKRMVEAGKIRNLNADLPNTTAHYTLASAAMPAIKDTKQQLSESLQNLNRKRNRKHDAKKPKESAMQASVNKMQEDSKKKRIAASKTTVAASRAAKVKALRKKSAAASSD